MTTISLKEPCPAGELHRWKLEIGWIESFRCIKCDKEVLVDQLPELYAYEMRLLAKELGDTDYV